MVATREGFTFWPVETGASPRLRQRLPGIETDVALKLGNLRPWNCAKEPLPEHAGADRDDMYDSLGKTLLVGRMGEACEIAWAYLFLMQEE